MNGFHLHDFLFALSSLTIAGCSLWLLQHKFRRSPYLIRLAVALTASATVWIAGEVLSGGRELSYACIIQSWGVAGILGWVIYYIRRVDGRRSPPSDPHWLSFDRRIKPRRSTE